VSSVVNTSLTIAFQPLTAKGVLMMEIDSRPEGINKGQTTFYAGDSPGFLMYKSSDVKNIRMHTSEGGISSATGGTMEIEEFVTFANSREGSFSKPRSGGFTIVKSWGGNPQIQVVGETSFLLRNEIIAVVKIRYTTSFSGYRLSGASGEAPVLIVAIGESDD